MCRLLLAGFFTLTLLLSITMPAEASAQASETGSLTYRFADHFLYHGAFHDSKAAWNQLAQRVGAPQLRHDHDGRDVSIRIGVKCEYPKNGTVSAASYTHRDGTDLLLINRCNPLSPEERRMIYSHEFGHALLGPDHPMGNTVLRSPLAEQQAVYPTAKDGQMLARVY